MTPEEKARAYADRYEAKPMAETAIRAYIAGHFEALASQWVSVEEQLPEEGQEVLLYDVNSIRHYVIGWRRKKGDNKSMWALSNGFVEDKDITHWLPIPQLNPEKQSI
ncbi:DUF551 domain-containing protein [Paramuribaculum intestinale]|uniref:DUF551 domain-containing protein n=1 Tax=Paramuribaculum intestinale TaxID=2094151 RepID=UPI0025A97190|nr:DUF551 domain-containing protein [Paramuribaculum intestinale]